MRNTLKTLLVLSAFVIPGILRGDDVFVIDVNQSIGPDPGQLSGTWVFPTNPAGDLLVVLSVTLDIDHSQAADIAFSMPDLGLDLVNGQGGNAILNGEYTFVESGGAPAGTWGDGPGTYNANAWHGEDAFPYIGIEWDWRIEDIASGNDGFVRSITIVYDGGIIPEPSSAIIGLIALVGLIGRRRR